MLSKNCQHFSHTPAKKAKDANEAPLLCVFAVSFPVGPADLSENQTTVKFIFVNRHDRVFLDLDEICARF